MEQYATSKVWNNWNLRAKQNVRMTWTA